MFGTNTNFERAISDFIGLNSFGVGQVRTIEWGKKHLWAVRFIDPKPPAPFGEFFPATDVSIPVTSLDSYSFDRAQSTFFVPQKNTPSPLSLTFFDDQNMTLFNWMRNWIEVDILNDGKYVSCLKDSHPPIITSPYKYTRVYPIRTLELTMLDSSLVPVPGGIFIYEVYPDGGLEYSGSSDSAVHQYNITFNIVGRIVKDDESSTGGNDILKKAKKTAVQVLGRFF